MKLRTKIASASIAVPVAFSTPALATDQATPEPDVSESATPDPTASQTPTPDPSETPTSTPDPTTSSTPEPVATVTPAPQNAAATIPTSTYVAPVAEVPKSPSPTSTYVKKRAKSGKRTSRAGFTMRVTRTRFSPLTAVKRLKRWAKRGRAGYRNGCLRLADDAYRPYGGRVSTALSQWYRAKRYGYAHGNRFAPVGAQLFWRTSNPAGHVATYIGRGKVVTNVRNGRVKVRKWKTIDRWGPYLGWAEPYYG